MITRPHRRLAAAVTSAAFAVALLAACSPSTSTPVDEECEPLHTFPTVQEGKLTVAAINAPPKFFAASPEGPYEGIDGAIIEAFAAENCLELDLKPMTGAAAVLDLTDGKSDIMIGGILKSAVRAEQFNQAEGQLTYETMGIGSREEDGFDSIDDLQGHKVGVQSGSSYTEALKAAIGAENVVEFQTDINAFEDLVAGRIDATAFTSLQSWYDSEQFEGTVSNLVEEDSDYPDLTQTMGTNWPHKKGADELRAAIDDFYSRIHADGRLEQAVKDQGIPNLEFYLDGQR